jgi:MFS family permease
VIGWFKKRGKPHDQLLSSINFLLKVKKPERVNTTTQKKENSPDKEADLKTLYTRSVVSSFGSGMVSPFTGAYAVRLGASSSDMGWFQSSTNLSNNLMQIFWGRLSDKTKRRIPFIVFGSVFLSVLWIPMIFVASPTQLIALLAIQALVGSMATPAWTALIGDLVPSLNLGRANATVSFWSSIGSVAATLASGFIMISIGRSIQEIFVIPILVAVVCGIASALVMLKMKEKKNGEKLRIKENLISDISKIFSSARNTPMFVKYCYVDGTFQFFMSIAWPLFAITQIKVLNASMLQIAVLSVVQLILTIAVQAWAGRLADTKGRKPLLIFFRFGLMTVPLAYAIAPNVETLIAVGVFWGFVNALGSASVTAYLLDISSPELRGSFIAVYNLVIGVITFVGSLIGGYLSDFTIGAFGLFTGLLIVYMISTVGRAIGAGLHFSLEETLKK